MGKFKPSQAILPTEIRQISEITIDFTLSFLISVTGIVTNTLVIIVFARLGYRESVNISMTTIALWDLAKCAGAALQRFAGPLSLWSLAVAESWSNVGVVVMNYFVCFSSYVTSVLAAYVAVERCLCVCLPFKVKWLLTPKVTLFMCVSISIVVFGCFAVMFSIYDVIWVFSPEFNSTIAIYRYNTFALENKAILFDYYNYSGIVWPTASFVVIVVCTTIIVYKLAKSSEFRKGNSDVSQAEKQGEAPSSQNLSGRDRQVVKMLVVIIAIYVINLSPRIALYIAKQIIFDFYFLRKYHNMFLFVVYLLYIFDLTNGAINFFVFYTMSTAFRSKFLNMLPANRFKRCCSPSY
ncbi:neuropeptide receptor 15-like [Aplysia californica]|uniref:Neuropeptide receptor 15-like n=1 Tax=Aplysia californica TaxID=6500 RepID=A0ABM0ZVQ7_APLCA|nr:neuropeptide receptor 15-like [Aplysia californica]